MQAATRNPLAGPSILGVSSGASFAIVSAIYSAISSHRSSTSGSRSRADCSPRRSSMRSARPGPAVRRL
ncbi:MAG: iron chelate uptake ABC transporter family permease subunit [Dehalococcoidia bacterium]|nr:iron chelate uptake ABC transporter family permease subunit [Dehalococcoidia bacterium]